jgi:hypothetical protein
MKDFIKKKLIKWGIRKPDFYSYYVGSRHIGSEQENKDHEKYGSCSNCGYWQKVDSFEEIPKELTGIKGSWRKHIF